MLNIKRNCYVREQLCSLKFLHVMHLIVGYHRGVLFFEDQFVLYVFSKVYKAALNWYLWSIFFSWWLLRNSIPWVRCNSLAANRKQDNFMQHFMYKDSLQHFLFAALPFPSGNSNTWPNLCFPSKYIDLCLSLW